MSWILTASARQFDFLAPDPAVISILDIATPGADRAPTRRV